MTNLSEKFEYKDGFLYHKSGRNKGMIAGPTPFGNGYRYCWIDGKQVLQHRAIYALCKGLDLSELPDEIDHEDLDTLNNKIENLRDADSKSNQWNITKKSHNKSGYKGVWWAVREGKWTGQITVNGVKHPLGYHDDPEEIARRYQAKANELQGRFVNETERQRVSK